MRLSRTLSLLALVSPFALVGACSVDTDGLVFDDDEFADASGDGDLGGASGDGDGDGDMGGASGDGDGDGDGDVTEPECTMVGELQCDGKQVQVCSGFEFIDVGPECEFVCRDGACAGECVPGSTDCESATAQIACDAQGQWAAPTTCQFACVGDECGGVCTPGARDCGPSGERRLCDDTGSWTDQGACSGSGGCEDGVCTSCSEIDETQCTADGKLQTCDGSNWDDGTTCEFVCLSGGSGDAACGGVCVPESERCGGSGDKVRQFCNSTGAWVNGESCPYVCNETAGGTSCSGECVPGSVDCRGTVVSKCDSNGTWQSEEDCAKAGEFCTLIDKEPVCRLCVPGAPRCNRLTVESCNEDGTAYEKVDSCRGEYKAGVYEVCLQGQCRLGSQVCSFTKAQGCLSSEERWGCSGTRLPGAEFTVGKCPLGEACVLNSCEPTRGG